MSTVIFNAPAGAILTSAVKAIEQTSCMISEKTWEKAAPLIERALKYQDTHDLEDVQREVWRQKAQLWCGEKSAIVTELHQFPQNRRKARIWLAAGDMDELVNEMLPDVEEWARKEGCMAVTIVGRKGWLRKLQEHYRQDYVTLERTL